MTIIEQFLNHYQREYNFYREIARLCAQQCEIFLESSGIRSIVTHRAKRPDRLEKKVAQRAKEKRYQTVEDIYADIVDLAGVRIALYFPGEEKYSLTDQIRRSSRSVCVTIAEAYRKRNYPAE